MAAVAVDLPQAPLVDESVAEPDDVYDPDVEYDDPEYAAHLRWRSLTPEQQVDALNECSELQGVISYWKVEQREVVRDRELEQQEWARELAWRERRRRESWQHALASRSGFARIVRPLIRVRDRGRARRGRRIAVRRTPARSPGRRDFDPPSRPPAHARRERCAA